VRPCAPVPKWLDAIILVSAVGSAWVCFADVSVLDNRLQ